MTQGKLAEPLVSVVIPTYRRPAAVRAAVLSALGQTWTNVEVIVVSDGPDPATRASLSGLLSSIQLIELETNQGPAAARNVGVEASHGIWLAFLDDDDLMLPTRLEEQMRLADPDKPSTMISCRSWYRHGGRQDLWPQLPIQPEQDLADYLLTRPSLLGRPGVVSIQSLLMHRSVVKKIPFASHADHEDWSWLLQAWYRDHVRIVFAWKPLVIYNIDTSSTSRSRRLNWEDSLDWARQHRRFMGDRAYCSFLATKVALKARRAGDWKGGKEIAYEVLKSGPGLLELLFLVGTLLLPGGWVQDAWRRSLRSKPATGDEEIAPFVYGAGQTR